MITDYFFIYAIMCNLISNITDITIGIRISRSFRIKDILGAITDKIIYKEDSPLHDYFYDIIQNNIEMVLKKQNNSYLRITTDDLIFKHVLSEDVEKEIEFIEKSINYLLGILKSYKIASIRRIGIIYNHEITNQNVKFQKIIEDLTNKEISEASDFSFSFSKKVAENEALVKKDVNDYKNVIYMFKKLDENRLAFALDYQKYYVPPMDDIEKQDLKNFLQSSKSYLENTFYTSLFKNTDDQKEKSTKSTCGKK